MTDTQIPLFEPEETPETPLEETALARHYQRQGRALDNMRLSIANLAQTQVFVYSIQIKWPKPGKAQHTLMCKALLPEGPKITFHNDYGWEATLLGFAGRLRGGQVEWFDDGFPPENWMEDVAFYHKNQHYLD